MYGLSNGENIFEYRWPLTVKDQGPNPESFEAKYLKNCTRLKVKRGQIGSDVWAFDWQKYFELGWLLDVYGQGSNPQSF